MRAMRSFAVRHAYGYKKLYAGLAAFLRLLEPLIRRIGYKRLDRPVLAVEKLVKGFALDSQSCGQCVVGSTGMSCPMNCPKSLRNGPCGGVRQNGKCEVDAEMDCVWVKAWEGNKRLRETEYPIQFVQPALDNRKRNTSAWLRELRRESSAESPEVLR